MRNKGTIVTTAGVIISLALGFLYAWSIIKSAIRESIARGGEGEFNWPLSSLNDPYSVSVLIFAFTMIISGRIQDRLGPRFTTFSGTFLVTTGLIISALSTNYWIWIAGFGVLTGMGIGFSYAAITPACIKWYPPDRTGLVAGFVVAGFGLAPVYIAPLFNVLIREQGLSNALLIFASGFFAVSFISTIFLKNPPQNYGIDITEKEFVKESINKSNKQEHILKTYDFYKLWFIYFIGAGAGLMVIGFLTEMASKSLGSDAFIAVIIIAGGNSGGRIVAGWISDKIGREKTMLIILLFQSLLMFAAIFVMRASAPNPVLLLLMTTLIGFNYGTNLSLFPSISKDKWGMKNFGINYGLLFTAWGAGGFAFSRISQMINAKTGSFDMSFGLAGALLITAIVLLSIKNK